MPSSQLQTASVLTGQKSRLAIMQTRTWITFQNTWPRCHLDAPKSSVLILAWWTSSTDYFVSSKRQTCMSLTSDADVAEGVGWSEHGTHDEREHPSEESCCDSACPNDSCHWERPANQSTSVHAWSISGACACVGAQQLFPVTPPQTCNRRSQCTHGRWSPRRVLMCLDWQEILCVNLKLHATVLKIIPNDISMTKFIFIWRLASRLVNDDSDLFFNESSFIWSQRFVHTHVALNYWAMGLLYTCSSSWLAEIQTYGV